MVALVQDNANNVLGIDPDVRELVYTQAVANGGAASYDIMRQLYLDVSTLHHAQHVKQILFITPSMSSRTMRRLYSASCSVDLVQ